MKMEAGRKEYSFGWKILELHLRKRASKKLKYFRLCVDLQIFKLSDFFLINSKKNFPNSIQRIDVAGRDVTRYLKLLLRKEGHLYSKSSEFEIVREIKEQRCRLHPTPLKDEPAVDANKANFLTF